jgi:hypothetical protein
MIRQIDIDIDYEKLLCTVLKLDIINMLQENPQLAVHRRVDTLPSDQLSEGCNSLIYNWDNYDPAIHKELPKRINILNEKDFNITCDLFKDTYIETVTNILNELHGVYRGRLMTLRHKTCLSTHTDETYRIHIPLITNPYCFMVIEDTVYKMTTNASYIVNTMVDHTAVNSGRTDRLHLVFCTGTRF